MGQLVEEGRHIGPAVVADGLVFDVVLDWDSGVSSEQTERGVRLGDVLPS